MSFSLLFVLINLVSLWKCALAYLNLPQLLIATLSNCSYLHHFAISTKKQRNVGCNFRILMNFQKFVFFKKKTDFWEIKIQLNSKGHPKSLGALKLLTDIGWSAQKFNADCCLIGTDINKYLIQYFLIIKIMLSVHQMKEWDHEIRREDEKPIEIVF